MDNLDDVDTDEMHNQVGVLDWELKMALGIPLMKCPAMNIKQAEELHHESYPWEEKRYVALLKWEELIREELLWTKTFKEASYLLEHSPDTRDSQVRLEVYAKWEELALKEIALVDDLERLADIQFRVHAGSPVTKKIALKVLPLFQKKSRHQRAR